MKTLKIILLLLLISILVVLIVLNRQRLGGQPLAVPPTSPAGTTIGATQTGVKPSDAAGTQARTQTDLLPVVPPADEAAQRLSVPAGFAIRIFADNLPGTPRFMTVGPDRQIYVSLYRDGKIARLPDLDQNGLADGVEIVASGLHNPHGIEWHDGWLYVAETGRVSRLKDADQDGVLETRETVTENIPGSGGHSSRTLHFGPDGKMYVSAGSSCNVCVEGDPRRAAILRFNPDGSIPADNPFAASTDERWQAVWAWGLRNSVDFLWTPSGQLWADHNGRDNLMDANNIPDTLPPEEIIIPVKRGMSHGWPYCYSAFMGINAGNEPEVLDTQNGLTLPGGFDCSLMNVAPALFTDLAHSAPLGMELGSEALKFPQAYRQSLYVAYHGSWNTTAASIRDCKVQRILLEGERPVSGETFISGWRPQGETCGSAATWGRPADVISGADGALYISDDKGGRVYRVVYVGE